MTDPIADMLTRIRNAVILNRPQISMPYSKIKEDIARLLVRSGYLADVKISDKAKFKAIDISICAENMPPAITSLSRLSRPGRRLYVKADEIPTVKRGRGIVIVSTSKGLMSGTEAKTKNLGGELICEVY